MQLVTKFHEQLANSRANVPVLPRFKVCIIVASPFNSLPTECHLLITFANSLDADQAKQYVGPDLSPNYLTH